MLVTLTLPIAPRWAQHWVGHAPGMT